MILDPDDVVVTLATPPTAPLDDPAPHRFARIMLDDVDVTCQTMPGLTVTFGRASPTEETDAATVTGQLVIPPTVRTPVLLGRFLSVAILDPFWSPAGVRTFLGRITDESVVRDRDGARVHAFAAASLLADLATVTIGDTPWPSETVRNRYWSIQRAVADRHPGSIASSILTGWAFDPAGPSGSTVVAARDVDAQPVLDLLRELARSIDHTLTYAPEPFFGPLGSIVTVPNRWLDPSPDAAVPCDRVELSPRWSRSRTELVNTARVVYGAAPADGSDRPSVTVRNDASVASYGPRETALTTALANESDAAALGAQLVAGLGTTGFAVDGVRWTHAAGDRPHSVWVATAFRRGDRPSVIWLPSLDDPSIPRATVVDGGTDTLEPWGWQIERTVSDGSTAVRPLAWDAAPGTWDAADPAIRWDDVAHEWPITETGD